MKVLLPLPLLPRSIDLELDFLDDDLPTPTEIPTMEMTATTPIMTHAYTRRRFFGAAAVVGVAVGVATP